MKNLILIWCVLPMHMTLFSQSQLEQRLFELPDVVFQRITTPNGCEGAFELRVKQPLDHDDKSKGYFYQRCYLTHRGMDNPVVFVTEGYDRPQNRMYELSEYVNGNQCIVEHRFFGASVPDSMDFHYLNLYQATRDLHRINELMGRIYSGPFVSTGISKGGMTTLYYKHAFPEDVEASVAYVAPMIEDIKDPRIYDFLDTVGTESCRDAIQALQLELLKNQDAYKPLLYWYYKGKSNTFKQVGFDKAYELAVLEFSFSFWQFGHDCTGIPTNFDDREATLDYFLSVSGIDFFGDQDLTYYAPFYYQMGSEMGYYGYETNAFSKYIESVDEEPSAVFVPKGVNVIYDPAYSDATQDWLRTAGDKIIYINGNKDPWAATAMSPNPEVDAVVLNISNGDHRTARITGMSETQRAMFNKKLEKWMSIELSDK